MDMYIQKETFLQKQIKVLTKQQIRYVITNMYVKWYEVFLLIKINSYGF